MSGGFGWVRWRGGSGRWTPWHQMYHGHPRTRCGQSIPNHAAFEPVISDRDENLKLCGACKIRSASSGRAT